MIVRALDLHGRCTNVSTSVDYNLPLLHPSIIYFYVSLLDVLYTIFMTGITYTNAITYPISQMNG